MPKLLLEDAAVPRPRLTSIGLNVNGMKKKIPEPSVFESRRKNAIPKITNEKIQSGLRKRARTFGI